MTHITPITPGELLRDEFLEPMGITPYRLAKDIHVPATRIGEILNRGRAITADTDLRLCRYFGLSEGYFLRAQMAHDLDALKQTLKDELETIEPCAA